MCPEMRLIEVGIAYVLGPGRVIGHSGVVSKDRSSAYQWDTIEGVSGTPLSLLHVKLTYITSHGRIDDKALTAVAAACDANPSLGVKLRDLTLHDQSVYEKVVKKRQKARRVGYCEGGRYTASACVFCRDAEYYAYRGG